MKTARIRSRKAYKKALARFEIIFHAKAGTKRSDEADRLALQIAQYEETHFNELPTNQAGHIQK